MCLFYGGNAALPAVGNFELQKFPEGNQNIFCTCTPYGAADCVIRSYRLIEPQTADTNGLKPKTCQCLVYESPLGGVLQRVQICQIFFHYLPGMAQGF